MNIFALDNDPIKAAQMHNDKHVVKMILETAQMLSTVSGGPYRPTHKNHPCTVWARQTKGNYDWLVQLGFALCHEYGIRYNKQHKCQSVIERLQYPPESIPDGDRTPFAQAMPDDCKADDAITAYRTYYKQHKAHIAKWTNREAPQWI